LVSASWVGDHRLGGHYYCPQCESVWGSLAWLDPDLAAEWHPDNELTAWHVKPFSTGVVVRWRCAANPQHEWEASVSDRSSGRLCPRCSTAGTSQIEKAFLAAARQVDPEADAAKVNRWRVDVLMPSLGLIVEYDGEYWHAGKHETDTRKTRELIALGYRVAGIRENDLPHLQLETSRLRQASFRPAVGRPEAVMQALVTWAGAGAVGPRFSTSAGVAPPFWMGTSGGSQPASASESRSPGGGHRRQADRGDGSRSAREALLRQGYVY
jgi:hypothetical protein